MMKKMLLAVSIFGLAVSPTGVFAKPVTGSNSFFSEPLWPTDPACEARARVIASRAGPEGSAAYEQAYGDYFMEHCPYWG